VNARLCTPLELQDGCAAGTGCGHDADLVWTSAAGTLTGPPQLAQNAGGLDQTAVTSTEEPGTGNQSNLQSSEPSGSSTSDDESNAGAIAGAIIGTLGVIAVVAAILYVRQQGQRKQQPEADEGRPGSLNPLALGDEEEAFRVAPNGQSIRLESVKRGNPMFNARPVSVVAPRPLSVVTSRPVSVIPPGFLETDGRRRSNSYSDTLDTN
jgi:hypothetical protein